MATSMQFGPEWMRKAPAKNSSTSSLSKDASSPASGTASARSDYGSAATSGGLVTGKRNGAFGVGLGGIPNGPTPVASPTVTSPGAFSFAAAAGGAASAATAGTNLHALGSSSQDGDSVGSLVLSNGAAAAKDRQSREKLLSLYSTDRPAKGASVDAATLESGSASDKALPPGRKKVGVERDQRRLSNFSELGAGVGTGPLSPSLGGEPRGGFNVRSTSGGSSGGFGSAGTSNWDRADKERPGLFQRASSSTLTGAASAARPLSPSIPRERFGGIQGGVLSGVGPQSRKRMESDNGSTAASRAKPGVEEASTPSAGSGQTTARTNPGFSEAFSSNKVRGKPAAGDAASNSGQEAEGAESANASGRFGRARERQPGEGPIGPPADGSAGFNKFAGYDRKRERQASQAKMVTGSGEAEANGANATEVVSDGGADSSGNPTHARQVPPPNANDSSMDSDLAHHATAVLGSLKLDEDDPSAQMLPSNPPKQATTPPWSAETAFWLYRDPSGQVQGPFAAVAMQDWYRQSYFSDDLMVRRQEDTEFRPLAQVIAAIGNALQPFLIPPYNWLQNPDARPEVRDQGEAGSGGSHAGDTRDTTGLDTPANQDHDPTTALDQGSRFAAQMEPINGGGGWNGASQTQQQWPSQLNLGFASAAPQPMSPFVRQDIFAGQGGLDARFRTQEELVALIREREAQEQRQAAAAAAARGQNLGYGQLDPFMGMIGRGGWDAAGAANWAPHGGLPPFDPAFANHPSPLISERQAFDAFNMRGGGSDAGSGWAKGPSTPRSHFEQPNPFNRPGHWDQQGAWSQGNMTPETPSRQVHDLQEGAFRHDNVKPFSDPIGTPRRARSPAAASPGLDQAPSKPFEDMQEEGEGASTPTAPESEAEPAPAPTVTEQAPDQAVIAEDTPKPKEAAEPVEEPKQEPVEKKEPEVKAGLEAAPVVEEEPGPEQLWPQSPKAVEFASEPDLSSMPALKLSGQAQASTTAGTGAHESRRSNNRAEAKTEAAKRSSARQNSSAGNVRVVSQEQFRRPKEEESSSLGQAPLSAWLPDAAPESPAPTPKPAPWASRDDASSVSTPGPSLREIQEAEAKRAEARKAAERAAAAQRAKAAAAAASSDNDLPTSMSWGLASVPATRSMSSNNDTPLTPTSSGAPSMPAWSAGKTAAPKKTLMEIQEEERRRAEKQKQQQAAQAVALRKGYADSASRTAVPSATASAGGAWSVVGAGGKSSASSPAPSAATVAARPGAPTAQRTSSVGVVPGAGSGWTTAGAKTAASSVTNSPSLSRVASQPVVASPVSSALKPKPAPLSASSNDINQPSPEFVRYLKENLKGLTIRADDFIEMLMSFPLDPSPDVIEIIAESVYANSSTLDGRRFAADFVSKRKMDVQGRQQQQNASTPFQSKWSTAGSSGGMGTFGSGAGVGGFGGRSGAISPATTRSAADVMKGNASKPGADSFSGFKVVKAKGNKKRAN
ncbi:kinesin-like protein [Thecaphora frezii]